jgi:hypothetical protein
MLGTGNDPHGILGFKQGCRDLSPTLPAVFFPL